MNFNDGKSDVDLNQSITPGTDSEKTEQEKLDHAAMDAAKRAGHHIQQDKQETPDSTLFTK